MDRTVSTPCPPDPCSSTNPPAHSLPRPRQTLPAHATRATPLPLPPQRRATPPAVRPITLRPTRDATEPQPRRAQHAHTRPDATPRTPGAPTPPSHPSKVPHNLTPPTPNFPPPPPYPPYPTPPPPTRSHRSRPLPPILCYPSTKELLEAAPRLARRGQPCRGYDNVTVPACSARGVWVTTRRTCSPTAKTADLAWARSLARPLRPRELSACSGPRVPRLAPTMLLGREPAADARWDPRLRAQSPRGRPAARSGSGCEFCSPPAGGGVAAR